MKTLFLHFTHEPESAALLAPHVYAGLTMDVVGKIHAPTGVLLETPDGPVPEMAPLPGWFVNVLGTTLPDELQPFEIFPENPVRVFGTPDHVETPVPQACTRRQGQRALLEAGKLDAVGAAMAGISDPFEKRIAQVEYEAATWERSNPFLIGMWSQLGGTDEELDGLFRLAVTF